MIAPIDLYARKTCLAQLARLVRIRSDYYDDMNELAFVLIDHGIAAVARECSDLGASGQAARILGRAEQPKEPA